MVEVSEFPFRKLRGARGGLFGCLLRLYPTSRGAMRLDGVDLGAAPLAHARSRIRLCAQDALLHRGTLLENLTAFASALSSTAADGLSAAGGLAEACWAALADVGLRERVTAMPLGLATAVGAAELGYSSFAVELMREIAGGRGRFGYAGSWYFAI